MAIFLGLLAALSYGASDFAAGLASRRIAYQLVTVVVQLMSVVTAVVAVLVFPGVGPTLESLTWGGISGAGSALGTLALYRGLAVGQMSVVAPLSAVVAVVLPVVVGLMSGETLSPAAAAGIGLAVPAIALIAWHGDNEGGPGRGILAGTLSGVGFAVLFIALDQAGTQSGAWPVVSGQIVALLLVLPLGWRYLPGLSASSGATLGLAVVGGLLGGGATALFLASTHYGQLSIVAVLTSLYPAVTVVLARLVLDERWSYGQVMGLVVAAMAIVLISTG